MSYTSPVRVEQTKEFRNWLDALNDRAGRARILVRVDRLIYGNPGRHRNLGNGVSELKIDFGPGYRVHYTWRVSRLLLLLAGGDKSSQQKDIARAVALARNFRE
jgi:putative addiction module killer protein